MMRSSACLLAFFFLRTARAVLDMNSYYVAQAYCTVDVSQTWTLQYFAPRWGAPPPVKAEGGELFVSYPLPRTISYAYEGARYNASRCSFCPYSSSPPETRMQEYLAPGGIRNQHIPMHGPCLNGAASTRMPCVQNLLLHPPEFVGEYFYPEQRVADPRLFAFPFFAHEWIEGSFSSSITNVGGAAPTNYALGRGNALANLQSLRVMNNATGTENSSLSRQIQAPYLAATDGAEWWAKWEQHFCRQGCHRDSQRQIVNVRASDYEGRSLTLAYLNRRSLSGDLPSLVRCARCPPLQAAYNWGWYGNPNMAADPAQHLAAFDCYPWFGSVPTMVLRTVNGVSSYVFNVTRLVNHSAANDGVSYPAINGYVEGRPCPPNTYNDACAHKHKYDTAASGKQPACKPCPAGGWHTGGLSGAWFCQPPPGKTMFVPDPRNAPLDSPLRTLMNLHRDPITNASLLWARRDILGVEFECGNAAAHCYQCADAFGTTALPDEFNWEVILKNLLMWSDCPSGYYCPTAMEEPIACPAAKPWSPSGSASLGNCTCARGTYLRPQDNACAPCADRSACPSGQFMAGWTRCAMQDGATSPGSCAPCTNLPPGNAAFGEGAGKETALLDGRFAGVCPFACSAGARLTGGKTCAADYRCTPIAAPLRGQNGELVYLPELSRQRDAFFIWPQCGVQLNLTIAAARSALPSSSWPAVATSCVSVNPDCMTTACVITRYASYDANYECAPCPSPPPADGYYMRPALGENPLAVSATCRARCMNDGFYYNATANACQSCAAFEAAYCPSGGDYHVSGGGCYGSNRPFPASMDPVAIARDMCVQCALPMPGPGKWLSLTDTPCATRPCSSPSGLGVTVYATTLCGNTSDIVTAPCATSCPNSRAYYLKGQCQPTATPVCTPCTAYLPGSYLVANCTPTADAEWAQCSVPGTYCPGDGSVAICPNNQTSSPGAMSAASCYCPVGTMVALLTGACEPYRCPPVSDALQFIAPGASYVSPFYMALDEQSLTTKCVACPTNSLSIANDGIGLQSCLCSATPSGYWYMRTMGTNSTGAACAPCPAQAAPCPDGGRPDTCWRGVPPSDECVNIPPPFSLGALPGQCTGGFEPASAARTPLEDSTGSAVYAPRSALGWSFAMRKPTTAPTSRDYTIRRLATTSDWNMWGDASNVQFMVWTVAEPTMLAVFAAPYPPRWPESDVRYNPYGASSSAWSVTRNLGDLFLLEEIAVAQWVTPQTPERLFPTTSGVDRASFPTHVGAVLRVFPGGGATTSLRLYVNALSVDVQYNPGAPLWDTGGRAIVSLGVPPNASTVALGHAYVASVSTFYLGYNSVGRCGIAAVSLPQQGSASTSYLDLGGGRTLDAVAFMSTAAYDGVQIYMVFRQGGAAVRMLRWAGTSSPETDELFFPGAPRVRSLQIARPDLARAPIFTALVNTPVLGADSAQAILHPGGPPRVIRAADNVQRTFTQIQGMNNNDLARPTLLAPSIPVGYARLAWVASEGTDLLSITTSQCMPDPTAPNAPRYWDGGQCLPHACVRSRPCTPEQAWDIATMQCVCRQGYYTLRKTPLTCTLCPEGSYCANGTRGACPDGMTTPAGAADQADCACRSGYTFNQQTGACDICKGGAWCPNGWDSLPCPGSRDLARTVDATGYTYPTLCLCAPGSTGVACAPCPDGYYCPVSGDKVANFVAMATLLRDNPAVCAELQPVLAEYLVAGSMEYIVNEQRALCTYIPPPSGGPRRTPKNAPAMVVVMVQSTEKDFYSNVLNALPAFLNYNSTRARVGVDRAFPITLSASRSLNIAFNAPTACPVGKTPSPADRASCICRPGYEQSGTQCVACVANRYKATAGPGVCVACPIGTYSAVAASGCVSASPSSNGNTKAAAADDKTPLIIGVSVGGAVVVVLIGWGIYSASHAAAVPTVASV